MSKDTPQSANEESAVPAKVPEHSRAVALQYAHADDLPRVVASGVGEIARKIIELADDSSVPVVQDSELTELLGSVNIGAPIREDSFQLVAEILCFLHEVDKEWRARHPQVQQALEAAPRR